MESAPLSPSTVLEEEKDKKEESLVKGKSEFKRETEEGYEYVGGAIVRCLVEMERLNAECQKR